MGLGWVWGGFGVGLGWVCSGWLRIGSLEEYSSVEGWLKVCGVEGWFRVSVCFVWCVLLLCLFRVFRFFVVLVCFGLVWLGLLAGSLGRSLGSCLRGLAAQPLAANGGLQAAGGGARLRKKKRESQKQIW